MLGQFLVVLGRTLQESPKPSLTSKNCRNLLQTTQLSSLGILPIKISIIKLSIIQILTIIIIQFTPSKVY